MTTAGSHRWQGLNTQLKTGAAFALLALLLFSLVGFLSGQLARRQVAADTGSSIAQVAARLSASLDADMFERYREIQNLADLDTVLGADSAAARWRPVLEKLQQTYPYYAWIGITDAEGSVLAATGGVLEGRSVAQRPWFQQGRNKPFAGDVHDAVLLAKLLPPQPYNGNASEPLRLVDVAAPVIRDGQVAAVLGAHLSWRWADERRRFELKPIEAERQLEVLVVNGRGEPLLDVAAAPGISWLPMRSIAWSVRGLRSRPGATARTTSAPSCAAAATGSTRGSAGRSWCASRSRPRCSLHARSSSGSGLSVWSARDSSACSAGGWRAA